MCQYVVNFLRELDFSGVLSCYHRLMNPVDLQTNKLLYAEDLLN